MEFYGIWFHKIPYICFMIQRIAKLKLIDLASKFKAVAVSGARQTGKTISWYAFTSHSKWPDFSVCNLVYELN